MTTTTTSLVNDPFIDEVIAAVPERIIAIDERGTIVFATSQVEELLGYAPEELIDHSLERLAPTGRDVSSLLDTIRHQTSGGKGPPTPEYDAVDVLLEHKDGHNVPVALAVEETDYEDRRFFTATLRDSSDREELEQYQTIVETWEDGVYTLDSQGRFTLVNNSLVEQTGYTRDELLGTHASLLLEQADIERGNEVIEELLTTDRDVGTYETTVHTADGETVPAELRISLLTDEEGAFRGTVGVARELTERKAYEEKLKALNEASRELLSADTEQAIATTAIDVVQGVLDRSLTTFWRYDPTTDEEVLRPLATSEGATALIDSDDSPTVLSPIQAGTVEMEVFREGETRLLEDYGARENRAHPELPLETRLVIPLGDHGVLAVGARGNDEIDPTMQDLVDIVSQSTRAAFDRLDGEKKTHHRSIAMEAAIDGMAIHDEAGEFRYVNRAHADIYGYDDPDDLLGKPWHCLYNDDETNRFERDILPTLREQGHWRGEAVGTHANGTTFPQEVSLTALEDDGLVCVVRDITDRKRYEERLEALNAASQELTQIETADEVARIGLQAVTQILGFDIGCVRFFDDEANTLEPVAMTDKAEDLVASRLSFDLESSLAGQAYRQKEFVHNERNKNNSYGNTPEQASLHLPIGEHGTLTILTREAEHFEDLDISLAEALTANIRAALNRAAREETLRATERERRQQHEQLDTLHRITSLVQEIGDHLIEATTREELEQTVCNRVAASELYQSAWIGEIGATADRVDVCGGAGFEDTHLDALDRISLARLGNGTVERALETGEIQIVRQYETMGFDSEIDDEHERNVEATAAVPLAYGDRIRGVLVVNGVREDVFNENALVGFESLGKLVGFALTALKNRKILLSDVVVELELVVADPIIFSSSITADLECRCEFDRSIPLEEGRFLNYHLIKGTEPARVLELAADADEIEKATVVSERDEEFVLQTVTDVSASQLALQAGASLQSAVAEAGKTSVTVEVPKSADIREVVEVFDGVCASVDLVAKRERERMTQSATEFREGVTAQLTDKQRAAFEAAYAAGYYDWPRAITAEELAESMGVSSSTLHQHLRRAVQSAAAAFFDDPAK